MTAPKLIYLIILIAIAHSSNALANDEPQYAVALIDDKLLENAKAVIRQDYVYYTVKSPNEANHKVHFAITMLQESDLFSDFAVHYDKHSKVKNLKARFYDANGKLIRNVDNDEIKDQVMFSNITLFSDHRLKHVKNEYGTFPYTFEIEYEINYIAIQGYPDFYFQHFGVAVEQSEYNLSIPSDMTFHHRVVNMDIKPKISKVGNNSVYQWASKNVAALIREPYMPNPSEIIAHLQIAPDQFKIDDYSGKMDNWKNFGDFIHLINKDRDQLPPETIGEIKKLCANATTNEEKIALLYKYLQENMRYVSIQIGIGGWQTFDANTVDKNKYGDCKALSNYMKAMLQIVGINAHTALISAGEYDFFQPDDNFCLAYFNHVILYLPDQNQWLECTSNDDPTGYLGAFTQGRKALIISKDGGKLLETPKLTETHNIENSQTTINLSENGNATISHTNQYKGALQDDIRNSLLTTEKDIFWKQYRERVEIADFTISEPQSDVSTTKPEVSISYKANSNKYASKAGTRLFVPINAISPINIGLESTEKRKHPIEISAYGFQLQDRIELQIPNGYQIETLPNALSLDTPYGVYQTTIAQKDNKIIF
jgi:hypothetical protein